MAISTHVLNAVTGRAAEAMTVRLEFLSPEGWSAAAIAVTNSDGRIPVLLAEPVAGDYRLSFDTGAYLPETFYPEVIITVRILDPSQHYHVPLLLSPYAYSTYRGT